MKRLRFVAIMFAFGILGCTTPTQPTQGAKPHQQFEPDPDPNGIHRIIRSPDALRNVPRPRALASVDVVDRILTEIYQDMTQITGTLLFTLDDPASTAEITGEMKRGTSSTTEVRYYITEANGLQFSSKQAMLDAIVAATPYRCEINPEKGICVRMLGWDLVPNLSSPWANFKGRVEGRWR